MSGQFIFLFLFAHLFVGGHFSAEHDKGCSSAVVFCHSIKLVLKSGPTQEHKCPEKSVFLLLLLLAGDVHSNPGPRPPKYPCGVCHKAVKWDPQAPSVCCDSCDVWYHQHCLAMPDAVFRALHNVSWECLRCGLPNFSTSLFDTIIVNSSNSFEPLFSPSSEASSDISFSGPRATSSPSKLDGRSLTQLHQWPGRQERYPHAGRRCQLPVCQTEEASARKSCRGHPR